MAFNILALRTSKDTDGTIWPLRARQPGGLLTEPEPGDGSGVVTLPVLSAVVTELTTGRGKPLMVLPSIDATVSITDSRVIFAASKWDRRLQGAGLSLLLALAENRGKILAGQIRYSWLKQTGASVVNGREGTNQIWLACAIKTSASPVEQTFGLDLTLAPWKVYSVDAAQDITRRCAAYWLKTYPDLDEDQKASFTKLTTAEIEPAEPGKFTFLNMPRYYYVGTDTS